jgi:hypothetical protein
VAALGGLRHEEDNAFTGVAAQMQAAARAWVEVNFDAHKNAAQLAALYRK